MIPTAAGSTAMKHSLEQVAQHINATVRGDARVQVSAVASIARATNHDLVFVEDEKTLALAWQSPAAAVIAGDFAAEITSSKPLLIASQPRLAFARAAQFLSGPRKHESGVHPSAVVHPSARVAPGAGVGERVVIGDGAEVGEGTRIGAGCVIGNGVRIGRDCQIYPNVTIYPGAQLADRVIIHAGAVLASDGFGYVRDRQTGRYEKFPQIGRLEIEDDVEIGANTTIDRGALEVTRIRRGTKIDNLVHVGHNCQIGEDVVIAAQTGFSGSIVVENNVILGGQVGIGEHARICEGVMLGGQGGVLPKKVLRGKGVAFWGTPAQPLRSYLKQLAAIARLAKK
jgi:UDP-3-O-[3-hydroxymyristoyl] glucosamine N-acyltransferase